MMLDPASRIAIIGGGFSGTMQAINLLRHHGPRAILIERRPEQLGRGVAYSAAHPSHLLNVRAANMSALPDDPGHFARWLAAQDAGDGTSFVSRTVYGDYLREQLFASAAATGNRLLVVENEAVDIVEHSGSLWVALADGSTIATDAVILAQGNLPPHAPPGLYPETLGADRYAADPWAGNLAEGLDADDLVVLLGTGLTAIDAALLLDADGFAGRILAISRRGLVPRAHEPDQPAIAEVSERPPGAASALVRHVRARAAAAGWRSAVDELRPMTQMMWAAASDAERTRFLRHLRPYWDVHRHRLAPRVAARIAAMQAEGRLRFAAGKLAGAEREDDGIRLSWRPRGTDAVRHDRVRRIVNCTGPQGDLLHSGEPLLRALLSAGRIRPDPLRLGLDVDAQSQVIDGRGRTDGRLFAIGPMTRGGLWEIVAVPDLRMQTWALARRLANAHWVGGEGL